MSTPGTLVSFIPWDWMRGAVWNTSPMHSDIVEEVFFPKNIEASKQIYWKQRRDGTRWTRSPSTDSDWTHCRAKNVGRFGLVFFFFLLHFCLNGQMVRKNKCLWEPKSSLDPRASVPLWISASTPKENPKEETLTGIDRDKWGRVTGTGGDGSASSRLQVWPFAKRTNEATSDKSYNWSVSARLQPPLAKVFCNHRNASE